ncbi:MAG: PQQ-binding-like beta-propeller repeat protein [Anaerolineales bacterium]
MKSKNILVISTLLLLSAFMSACSSTIYASTGWHGLTASSDTAYLAAGTQVYAVDLNTGSEKWRYPTKANPKISFYANPVLTADGQLIVPSYNHTLYSLNPATGTENWNFPGSTNRLIGSPLVTEKMIYQPSADDHIYAVDLTGKQVWVQSTGGPLWAQPATSPDCGCIYVASMDHIVYSFNAATGALLWKSPDLGGALVSTPAISTDGVLYIGTFGKEMIALDAISGRILWRFTTQDWVWSGPSIANNVLYFGDLSGYLYGLNAADGTTLWRIQPNNSIVDTPVVMGDKLYFTTEADTLYIVNTTGDIVNSKVIGGLIYTAPVIAGETILVAPTNFTALLVAMNLDGNQKWMFTPAK